MCSRAKDPVDTSKNTGLDSLKISPHWHMGIPFLDKVRWCIAHVE